MHYIELAKQQGKTDEWIQEHCPDELDGEINRRDMFKMCDNCEKCWKQNVVPVTKHD